jgi:hypothetical protein
MVVMHHVDNILFLGGGGVTYSALLLDVSGAGLALLLLGLSLLEKSLRNDVLLGGDRAAGRMSEHKVV